MFTKNLAWYVLKTTIIGNTCLLDPMKNIPHEMSPMIF